VFYVFLIVVALVGVGIYLLFILHEVPGAAEERLGRLVLPEDVGKWKLDPDSEQAARAKAEGLEREVRLLWEPNAGFLRRGRLVRQVRYRRQGTRAIERVEPDQVVKLRRVRS
jgi:hypothetical protein